MPIWMIPAMLAAKAAGEWLNKRNAANAPTCAVCANPVEKRTNCCLTPLCSIHFREWMADTKPCPCRTR